MNLVYKFLLTSIIFLTFFTSPFQIYAQEEKSDIYSKIVDALNMELNNVYTPYTNFLNRINTENYDITNSDIYEFKNLNNGWNTVFVQTKSVYSQHLSNPDPQIAEIATVAQDGANLGIRATDFYKTALETDDEDIYSTYIGHGDEMMVSAVEKHDEAVDLYNSYSGATDNKLTEYGLILGSIVANIFSMFLFFKSRKRSESDVEKIRSEIYKALFVSSLWFSGGLIVTTIGFVNAYENGGSYTIFWGAIAVGGWQLLRGLSDYFTNSRQILADLNIIEKNKVLREAFNEDAEIESNYKTAKLVVCRHCGSKQPNNRIVCNKCGENML